MSPGAFEPLDWYENALYYDIIFDAGTEGEADFLVDVNTRFGRARGRRVLEPGCGSGRLVLALARRGWRVTGFDASPDMLSFARRRLARADAKARLRQDRMESFTIRGPFDLAHCLVSTFKYLLDETSARTHLERVRDVLAPGGLYVLGVHLTDYADRRRNRERWVATRDGVEVTCNTQGWPADRRRRTEQVRTRLTVRENGDVRRFETEWMFRTYSARQLRSLVRSVDGLEHVATYGFDYADEVELDGDRLDVVMVLRRRDL